MVATVIAILALFIATIALFLVLRGSSKVERVPVKDKVEGSTPSPAAIHIFEKPKARVIADIEYREKKRG